MLKLFNFKLNNYEQNNFIREKTYWETSTIRF